MPVSDAIPEAVLSIVAAATVFMVMFDIGLGMVLREFRWIWNHPGLVMRCFSAC